MGLYAPYVLFAVLSVLTFALVKRVSLSLSVRKAVRLKTKRYLAIAAAEGRRYSSDTLLTDELNSKGLGHFIRYFILGKQNLKNFGTIMNFDQVLALSGLPGPIRRLLYRSKIDVAWNQILLQSLIIAVVCIVGWWRLVDSSAVFAIMAILTLPAAMFFVIYNRARLYRNMILQQLPNALDFLTRGLRAGHPLNAAMRQASLQLTEPIASEFAVVQSEVNFGRSIGAALMNMSNRLGGREFSVFAVAADINMRAGGNLGEALENLSKMLRERVLLGKKIRSITAEGRSSGYIMSVFPFLIYGVISLAAPDYFDAFWASDIWPVIVLIFAALLITGAAVVFSLTRPQ